MTTTNHKPSDAAIRAAEKASERLDLSIAEYCDSRPLDKEEITQMAIIIDQETKVGELREVLDRATYWLTAYNCDLLYKNQKLCHKRVHQLLADIEKALGEG